MDDARSFFNGQTGPSYNYRFPSPWLDASSQAMPTAWLNVLEWCEFLYYREPTLSRALDRVIAYLMTDIEFADADRTAASELGDDERNWWTDIFESIGYREFLTEADRNFVVYGNAYLVLQIPVSKRLLLCPTCSTAYPARDVISRREFGLSFSNYEFSANCPRCRKSGTFRIVDAYEDDPKKFVVRCVSPKEIEVQSDIWTGRADYYWRIPEDYKNEIDRRVPVVLENVHPAVLDALRNRQQYFLFEPDHVFHMKEPTLAGIRNRGVGLPRFFTQFRDIWYVQVIRRANESLAMDYLVPIRVLSPDARPGAGVEGGAGIDALLQHNQSSFAAAMRSIIEKHRLNPTDWHVSSFPLRYNILSGEGKQFVPKELLDQAMEIMLNSAGVPMDFYRGNIQMQTMPGSLRLIEQTWTYMYQQNNRLLTWLSKKIAASQAAKPVRSSLRRILFTEDFQKQMALLQLNMSQKVSDETAFTQFGLDPRFERRKILEEQRDIQELTAKMQEEMDQASFGQQVAGGQMAGGMPPGQPGQPMPPGQPGQMAGAPPGSPAGGMPPGQTGPQMPLGPPPMGQMSPEDMDSWATSKAQELLMTPEALKDSELQKLSRTDKMLHLLVKSKMDEMRKQFRLQGGAMLMGQTPPPA